MPHPAQRIAIVAHKFLTQPDDDLVLFLNEEKRADVLHICHSFSDAPDRKSSLCWYKRGSLYRSAESPDFRWLPEPLLYVKEFAATAWWLWCARGRLDTVIAMDGLLAAFIILLRPWLGFQKIVFWAIDFVPEKRFAAEWKNRAYQRINRFAYRRADEMWDLSPRMAEARERYLAFPRDGYRAHRVVPYGVWTERVRTYAYAECEQETLVFMGHLIEKQGVQHVLPLIPALVRALPRFRFKVIGGGAYADALRAQAEELGVDHRCDFLGKIADIQELEDEVARSAVGIAPYVKELDTWTYYADPGKVKTYLACGVPLLLTDLPWNASAIEAARCGMILDEARQDWVGKIVALFEPERNQAYRKQARLFAQSFNYRNIFQDLV